MAIRRSGDDNDPDVQLTSFMDCAFLLLIFFIVTASLKKPHKELAIELPPAGNAKLAKFDGEIILSVTENGERYLYDGKKYQNQAALGRLELMKYLENLSNTAKETPIVIDFDRRVRYFHIMDIIDTLELYGLKQLHLRAQSGSMDEKE